MNSGRVEVGRENQPTQVIQKTDALCDLSHPGVTHARVGMSVGTQFDFGRVKVTAYVEYECDQDTAAVNSAGELAFTKAVEFMNDGLQLLTAEEKSR